MARPLPLSETIRGRTNGSHAGRPGTAGPIHLHPDPVEEGQGPIDCLEMLDEGRTRYSEPQAKPSAADFAELEHVRAENVQLRALCQELEQALQEAAQQIRPDLEQQVHDYEAVVEEKNDMIRQLHQQIQELQAALEEAEARTGQPAPAPVPVHQGETPSEAELLALSEELERERRQLQEDEQSLMEQMREMEVSMARERAEMARQRNDLQRLQGEIRHELERLERDGGVQSKIDSLRSKLHDVTARRGAAPMPSANKSAPPPSQANAPRKEGLMGLGRFFKRGND
jgi:predicted  nucleic acid-binding Zn-ribbon protein